MPSIMDDPNDVREVIQLYIDGSNGDVAKLKAAFHPNARIFGHIDDNPTSSGPITDFFFLY